jgi:hypothetical protein
LNRFGGGVAQHQRGVKPRLQASVRPFDDLPWHKLGAGVGRNRRAASGHQQRDHAHHNTTEEDDPSQPPEPSTITNP